MLQALLVTFREGLESFLIVGVIGAYLRKTGNERLLSGVRVGLVASVGTCLAGAALWQLVPNQPLYEGIAALAAAALVGALLVQMLRMGRRMKAEIETRVARVSAVAPGAPRPRSSLAMSAGITLVTALLVTREGLEAVLYLGIQIRMAGGSGYASLVGAGAGLVLAGVVAFVWSHYAHRLNLSVVLKVTAVFLSLFLLQLVIYGVHELAESGVIEGSQAFHDATESMGPQGSIGHVLSYSLLAAPLVYLIWNRRARASSAAQRRPPAPA
ncbi:MAG: FTR1 family protein [Pseudomonadota bacterium]